jgi:hypothetical protein
MESATSTSDMVKKFMDLVPELEKKYGITLQLSRISGKRWAYAAGRIIKDILPFPPERIELEKGYGLIIYNGNKLNESEKQRMFESLKLKMKINKFD